MSTMRLRIVIPTNILLDETVSSIAADGTHGNFAVLPRHVDFLAALVPGLLSFRLADGGERFAAVDGGLLLKHGAEVFVPTRRAVVGDDLDRLRSTLEREFFVVDERERHARKVVARLEADFIRRFIELEKRGGA